MIDNMRIVKILKNKQLQQVTVWCSNTGSLNLNDKTCINRDSCFRKPMKAKFISGFVLTETG